MNTTITLNEKIAEALEKRDFRICSIDEQNGECCAELEFYSPAGEDVIVVIWYDGTSADFIEKFKQYAADFDPDEHAEGYVEFRGTRGVPNTIRELIDDADAIDRILQNMASDLADLDE